MSANQVLVDDQDLMMQVLNSPMSGDFEGWTLRVFLRRLLTTLWVQEDCFSGKRPFGNTGWQFDAYAALGRAALVEVEFDDDGYLDEVDSKKADELILAAIEYMCSEH